MDQLKELIKGFDLEALLGSILPDMETFAGQIELALRLAVMVGPLVLLGLGLYFFLKPPAEANYIAGFRSRRAMASVESWQFAQRLAGMVWGGLGVVLTVVMAILCNVMGDRELLDMAMFAMWCLVWELVLVAVSYVGINVVLMVFFDEKGNRREKYAHILF